MTTTNNIDDNTTNINNQLRNYNAGNIVSNWAALKAMASSNSKSYNQIDPDNPKSYYLEYGKKIYYDPASKRLADIKAATARPLRIDGSATSINNLNRNVKSEVEPLPKYVNIAPKDVSVNTSLRIHISIT
jgi:hypothetical protein